MLAEVCMDLFYLVGIAFLGLIFIAICMSAVNEFRKNRVKKKLVKELFELLENEEKDTAKQEDE